MNYRSFLCSLAICGKFWTTKFKEFILWESGDCAFKVSNLVKGPETWILGLRRFNLHARSRGWSRPSSVLRCGLKEEERLVQMRPYWRRYPGTLFPKTVLFLVSGIGVFFLLLLFSAGKKMRTLWLFGTWWHSRGHMWWTKKGGLTRWESLRLMGGRGKFLSNHELKPLNAMN